jgi:cytochrome c-type protein NapB
VPELPQQGAGRITALLGAAAVAVVGIGLVTGIEPTSYQAERPTQRERPHVDDVPPARSHAELAQRPWSGGRAASGWDRSLEVAAGSAVPASERSADLAATIAQRGALRAYDGAPPVIPHPVRAGSAAECLACHANGFALGNRVAGRLPHGEYASCTQCHVSAAPFTILPANAAAEAENSFAGLPPTPHGKVAWEGAPPAVPHSTRMRESCESCHGPMGDAALQTPHPERASCLQCHPANGQRGHDRSR